MRQTAFQFVQEFGVALREEPDGAEQKVLDRHLPAAGLYDLRLIGFVLQAVHGAPKAFPRRVIVPGSSTRSWLARVKHCLDAALKALPDRSILATWLWI